MCGPNNAQLLAKIQELEQRLAAIERKTQFYQPPFPTIRPLPAYPMNPLPIDFPTSWM